MDFFAPFFLIVLMLVVTYILSPLFFIVTIFRLLSVILLFQIKEYRFDRLLAHFGETKEGKRFLREFLFSKKALVLWALVLLVPLPFYHLNAYLGYLYFWAAAVVFTIQIKDAFLQMKNRQLRRPVYTLKMCLIFLTTTLIGVAFPIILFSPHTQIFFNPFALVVFDRLIIPIVFFSVLLLSFPTFVAKKILMQLAKRKITSFKNLKVIGVTGSYGKSSTKELIADFLSAKYTVLKTPGSVNTDLGIALFILRHLKKEHEMFVVEIGAYKMGEIASVCKMVQPTIGVLTGINEQHLSLFGSIENTKKAKLELIESLPSDGIALFNGDDEATRAMAKLSKVEETLIYSVEQLPSSARKKENPFLSNVAAAYLLVEKLDVTKEQLAAKLGNTVKTLGIKTQQRDSVTILDDSFNTNPKGFAAALDVLVTYEGKKILVTPGIIELGSESARIHRELGGKAGLICDYIVLTNDNFKEPFEEGLEKTKFPMENFFVPKGKNWLRLLKN